MLKIILTIILVVGAGAYAEDPTHGFLSPFGRGNGCVVRSLIGMRKHPVLGRVQFHAGVDIFPNNGSTNIFPVAVPAKITRSGREGACGNSITYVTESPRGEIRLCHLRQSIVKVGQEITSETDRIGIMGATGRATGVHLHIEMKGENPDTVNEIVSAVCKGLLPQPAHKDDNRIEMANKGGGATI